MNSVNSEDIETFEIEEYWPAWVPRRYFANPGADWVEYAPGRFYYEHVPPGELRYAPSTVNRVAARIFPDSEVS